MQVPVDLADEAREYTGGEKPRPKADPLGLRGLPERREDLDRLVDELCDRLRIAGEGGLRGRQLAEELRLGGCTRRLRELVAYAWIHRRIGQIVGVPGDRYYWGDARPELYARMADDEEQRGRDYFAIASIHRREADRFRRQTTLAFTAVPG